MIRRKGSTRKTRHIELKVFFSQQWSARPEVRLVQVATSEMLADCLTKIQSTPIRYISRSSDWQSNPVLNLFNLGRKDRAEEGCRNSTFFFDNFVAASLFFCFRSLSVLTRRIHVVLCSSSFWSFFNVSDVKLSNANGYLSRSMSIVFQPSHPDTGSPFGQGACDCSASGTGYAL